MAYKLTGIVTYFNSEGKVQLKSEHIYTIEDKMGKKSYNMLINRDESDSPQIKAESTEKEFRLPNIEKIEGDAEKSCAESMHIIITQLAINNSKATFTFDDECQSITSVEICNG